VGERMAAVTAVDNSATSVYLADILGSGSSSLLLVADFATAKVDVSTRASNP